MARMTAGFARVFKISILSALLLAAPAAAQLGPPAADLWPRWQRSGPGLDVDHGVWDRFLAAHRRIGRDGIARIAYARVPGTDRAALKSYLRRLQAADVDRMTRPEQLAYWINLYNAATVDLVLDAYPVTSIRRVHGGILGLGPWKRKILSIRGERLSLDDIEHRILRPIWRDPRIHYAVNCAALGCPNLAGQAFTAARANAILDQGARDFVNHPRGFRLDNGRLIASSIYDWFAPDFGGPNSILAHARRYATPATLAKFRGKTRPDRYSYDWSLNALR
jgi:hypothetical protein